MLVIDAIHQPQWAEGLERHLDKVEKMFDISADGFYKRYACPVCFHEMPLISMLAHLNNLPRDRAMFNITPSHSWSFKQIGEWLESIGL